jgi:hypothetical protein
VVRKTSDYVPAEHPLRPIRDILNTALRDMDRLFESMYEERGRYSIPPEWLLRGDNRSKLAVDTRLTQASGSAERDAALDMLARLAGERRKTVGADKNHDTEGFVNGCRDINVTPHVAFRTPTNTTPRPANARSVKAGSTVVRRGTMAIGSVK